MKKSMKKLLAVLLALAMVMSMAVPAFATTVKITINSSETNAEYAAYKLMDAVVDATGSKITYTVNSKYSTILQSVTGKTTDAEVIAYVAALQTDSQIAAFAKSVKDAIGGLGTDYTTTTGEFENVDKGYYLIVETQTGKVTGDLGEQDGSYSLYMLDTAAGDVTVTAKEDVPELTKKVKETNDTTGTTTDWQDGADYDIGDSVPFKLTGTVSDEYDSYTTYEYVFHDKMSSGLTLDASTIKVEVDGTEVTRGFDVTTSGLTDGCTFEVSFDNLKALTEVAVTKDSVVTVEFNATLNDDAVIGSAGNTNRAMLEYANNPYDEGTGKTPWDEVIVFTYKLVAKKVDENSNALSGAGFTLYKYDNATSDYVQVGNEITGVTTFEFVGADAGKYKLVETTVPAGYNKAEDLIFEVVAEYETDSANPSFTSLKIKDEDGNEISGEAASGMTFTATVSSGEISTNVVNKAGTELPSTGGIGTTIFYVVGGGMMAAAAVLLIAKKRMSGYEE